jgi:hypothetical protein
MVSKYLLSTHLGGEGAETRSRSSRSDDRRLMGRVSGGGGSFSKRGRVVSVLALRRLLELVVLRFRSEREKEIEILLLRHQYAVAMLNDQPPTLIYPSRGVASLFWDERGRDATIANLIGRTRSEILEGVGERCTQPGSHVCSAARLATSRSTGLCCTSLAWSHALASAESALLAHPARRHASRRGVRQHSRRVGETSCRPANWRSADFALPRVIRPRAQRGRDSAARMDRT